MPNLPDIRNRISDIRKKQSEFRHLKSDFRIGFTLIELLVVITIIALLIGATTAAYTNSQQKGRDGKRKSDLKALQQALENYLQQNGKYPIAGTGLDPGKIQCNAGTDSTPLTWGTSAFTCNNITYMKAVPKDPVNQTTSGYFYQSWGTPPTSYVISADLENTNDPERNPSSCTPYAGPPPRDYCVKNP